MSVVLNNYLTVVKRWEYQMKIPFNPDLNKQVKTAILSRKKKNVPSKCRFQ